MVTEYGMSPLGPMNFTPMYDNQDYGRAWGEPSRISASLQEKVDDETRVFIEAGYKRALEILKEYRKQLEGVSAKLVEIESIDAEEFTHLMGMKKAKFEFTPHLKHAAVADKKTVNKKTK